MDFHPVILAAGRGSRMYPLTEDYPKALLPVGNMPLIWYPIKLLENSGFKGWVIIVLCGKLNCYCSVNFRGIGGSERLSAAYYIRSVGGAANKTWSPPQFYFM